MNKAKTARFFRDVYCNDEYTDSRPDKATIVIDERLARRILKFARLVKRLGVYQIQEFDYTPDWYESGVQEPDWRLDCVTLDVADDHFKWTGLIKHTSIEVSTNAIYIKDLLKKFPHLKG